MLADAGRRGQPRNGPDPTAPGYQLPARTTPDPTAPHQAVGDGRHLTLGVVLTQHGRERVLVEARRGMHRQAGGLGNGQEPTVTK